METVDGNAIGGLMYEVFGAEMTAASGTCAHCGVTAQLAERRVGDADGVRETPAPLDLGDEAVHVARDEAGHLQDGGRDGGLAWPGQDRARCHMTRPR